MADRRTPTRSQPKGSCKRRLQFKDGGRTLRSKAFFLDIAGYKNVSQLEREITTRGGKVEKFFHREVKYLVTNRCHDSSLRAPSSTQSRKSPVKSASPRGKPVYLTRAARMVAAAKQKSGGKKNQDILEMAKLWNCKIISLNVLLSELRRLPSLKETSRARAPCGRVHTLTRPALKVEDQSRRYRPLIYEPTVWPRPRYDTPPDGCPFDLPSSSRQAARSSGSRATRHPMVTRRKKPGYCECCRQRYDNLTMHLRSSCHRQYAANASNYANLDALISQGTAYNDFVRALKEKQPQPNSVLQGDTRASSPWQQGPAPQLGGSPITGQLRVRPVNPIGSHVTPPPCLTTCKRCRTPDSVGGAMKKRCYDNSRATPTRGTR